MEPEAESGGISPEFAPQIAFLTASTPPEPTPRVKRAPDLIAGVATSPAKVEAGRPFQLRITLAPSKRTPRLVQIHLESVSHSIRRIRPLTKAEAAAAEIVERMPGMAEGAAEVAVTLYDDEGRTHRMVVGQIPIFRRNPVFVIFWPSMRSLRLSSGAARYDAGADVFRTETNFMFLNNTAQQVTLDPTGTRQTVDQNSNQISTGSVNFGAPIVLPAFGMSTGWWWTTTFPNGSTGYNKLKAKEEIRSTYTFKFQNDPNQAISSMLTWRAFLGPRINIIRVGVENFTADQNSKIDGGITFTRNIYEQVDFTIGDPIGRWHITVAQAGGLITIANNGDAEKLTSDWTVPNDFVDVFISLNIVGASGWSPVNGPCDKNAKGMTGSVVDIEGDVPYFGNSIAHELGHYLGLNHVADPNNFIGNNGDSDSKTGITVDQYNTMKQHCFVRYLA